MNEDGNGAVSNYDPNRLIDYLIAKTSVKNDAALARKLEVPREVISKVRHNVRPVGSTLLLKMHEATGISIAELRQLMGDRRKVWRMYSESHPSHVKPSTAR